MGASPSFVHLELAWPLPVLLQSMKLPVLFAAFPVSMCFADDVNMIAAISPPSLPLLQSFLSMITRQMPRALLSSFWEDLVPFTESGRIQHYGYPTSALGYQWPCCACSARQGEEGLVLEPAQQGPTCDTMHCSTGGPPGSCLYSSPCAISSTYPTRILTCETKVVHVLPIEIL
jgi:hypothetical protein